MRRPTKQEIDDEIVEHAAALFAQHGFKETSVQRIADAAGYSKTGLLHRFPSKEALWDAALGGCADAIRGIADTAADRPAGPARDRALLAGLADLTLDRPGLVTLVLSVFSRAADPEEDARLHVIAEPLMRAFGIKTVVDPCGGPGPDLADPERLVRVMAALGALVIPAVGLRDLPVDLVREHLVAASFDALGHAS